MTIYEVRTPFHKLFLPNIKAVANYTGIRRYKLHRNGGQVGPYIVTPYVLDRNGVGITRLLNELRPA